MKLQWDEQDTGVWLASSGTGVVFELVDWQDATRLSMLTDDHTGIVIAETDKPDVDRLKALAEWINDGLIKFHTEGGGT